ncbi:quinone-dependent dihydroorotate dehydrogenase [Nocardioides cavernaquae]|uniref:Dihydroorotate dehydrogenase (quinone) n=1 Tax=Nocardioides cavernaquae TaxID=2321396 RepID=A0A3A5HI25_9ACTN|nr:quinone-dependent dihydroorotate dehydrogenase [Nocardioides cavernaquae]RJS47347.1 quinone-dependent dihydroorotate dehydrogenase [Nocardioides cavernaquae]
MKKPYDVLFDGVFSKIDPEKAHEQAFAAIRAGRPVLSCWSRTAKPQPVQALGLTFPNVLGLAAGFDKNAVGIDALAGLGFGHIEIGTVTGEAQPGNPKPRLFRLLEDRAVINRMGFNNDGAEVVGRRLAERAARRRGKNGPIVGVNIGKTKVVPDDDITAVIADHEKSVDHLAPYADYLVVNVSSPNTPGLRNLQAVEKLTPLLEAVRKRADLVVTDRRVPLLVKIAPDLADDDVLAVADMAKAIGLDGIIATNTTISRDGLATDPAKVSTIGAGGLSGQPLTDRALDVMRMLKARVGDDLVLIGVGGITTAADAVARLDAGATLIQGYTAFIYEGPLWPRKILRAVSRRR